MKTTIKYILFLLLCLSSIGINAQSLSNVERRKMYMDVLNLINDYEKYAEVDGRNKRSFLRLFSDPATPIYNDLMGVSESQTMPAHEYADLMVSQAKYPEVIIRNVLHDTPQYADGKWYMHVLFDKELEYMDSCGIFEFSSRKHYGADYQMNALVSWDGKSAKIDSLEGSIDTDVLPYPTNYMIFEPRHHRDTTELLCNGLPIASEYYDRKAYAILPPDSICVFDYPTDMDIHITLNRDPENKVYYMTYKPKRWRIKTRYEQAVATRSEGFDWKNPLNVEAEFIFNDGKSSDDKVKSKEHVLNHTTSMRAFGVDLGYIFPSSGSVKWGLFAGAALRLTSIKTFHDSSNALKYNRWTSGNEDADNEKYLRQYEISELQYHTKINELYIPVYFDMDIRFSNRFSMYCDFGTKVYWAFKNPITSFSANYKVTGKYPDYGGVVFDETSFGDDYVLNGFVDDGFISETNVYSSTKDYGINFSVDVFTGLGFRARVFKDLYIDLGCNYQYNVGDIMEDIRKNEYNNMSIKSASECGLKDLDYLCEYKNTKKTEPLDPLNYIYDNDKEIVTSVSRYYKKIERNVLQFNVGLMFRF